MTDSYRKTGRTTAMDDEVAEAIAIKGLAFIASDPTLLQRFVGVTGIEPSQMRRAAAEPGFLAGVLRFIRAHEPTLIAFAAESGIAAADVTVAQRALPLGADDEV